MSGVEVNFYSHIPHLQFLQFKSEVGASYYGLSQTLGRQLESGVDVRARSQLREVSTQLTPGVAVGLSQTPGR